MTDTKIDIPLDLPFPAAKARTTGEGAMDRLRRLEASLTDDSQQHWLEVQDAQGEADLRLMTRVGMVAAVMSAALMLWLLV